MKRILVLLLMLAVASLAFSDDALVLPKGVLRTYITAAYGFATSAYDADADKQDMSGLYEGYKIFNLGGALEYGVTDWVSAAVQWAPGWNIWSTTMQGPMDHSISLRVRKFKYLVKKV